MSFEREKDRFAGTSHAGGGTRRPSVANGYWGLPAETQQTFPSTRTLRTGDLGFLSDGELFITGRIRELIIVAGRNLHPLDLELACEEAVPELRRGGGAAFAYESERGAEVGIAYEVPDGAETPHDRIIASIRRAVGRRFDVRVAAVALVKPLTIPKTSSGKVQRGRCRDAFLVGELETVATWRAPGAERAAPRERDGQGATAAAPWTRHVASDSGG